MQTRFLHAADIHLGYEQYNLPQRADDFARAFMAMVDHAIDARVAFVALAGDLFHRASADAWMLTQATHGLTQLRQAQIPVIAVEGNHDAQHAQKHLSWMEYLANQQLLILLNAVHSAGGHASLISWDEDRGRGSWIDIQGVRIYGIKYYGARTGHVLEQVGDEIEPGPGGYTILMLHAGIQGQVPHLHGGLTPGQLAPLHPPVDYLALGHVHKRLELDGWIYNPGSTETNSMDEIEWPHGFFEVEVDTAASPKHQVRAIATPGLRSFVRIPVNADGAADLDEFVAQCEERIASESGIPEGAAIELSLGGVAPFRRQDVPIESLKAAIEARFSPLTVRVRNLLVPPGLVSVRNGERLRRDEIERTVIEQLVYQEGHYRDRATAMTRLIQEVKSMAVEKSLPASIADHVQARLAEMDGEADTNVDPADSNGQVDVAADISAPGPRSKLELHTILPAVSGDESEGGEAPCMAHLFEDW